MSCLVPVVLLLSTTLFMPTDSMGGDDQPLPEKVDLRPQFAKWKLPPRAQGARNTCSVFVTVGAFEFALSKQHDRAMPLSVEYSNWACNQVLHNTSTICFGLNCRTRRFAI